MGKLLVKFSLFQLAFFSLITWASSWPLAADEIEEILKRSQTWEKQSEQEKEQLKTKLTYALHLAGSLEAHKVFFSEIQETWDNDTSPSLKACYLQSAKEAAERAGRKAVDKWKEARNPQSGRPLTAKQIILRLLERNLSTETFHEWDKFLDQNGRLNLRSGALGADTTMREEEREPVELATFLSQTYQGSPEARKAIERERAAKQRELENQQQKFPEKVPSPFCPPSHSTTILRACGTPGAAAPALNPHLNGR